MLFFRKSKESPLERLEREANDDFLLLAELGPEYFGAQHLLELREQLRLQMAQLDRWRRFNRLLGVTAGGWMLLAGLFLVVKLSVMTTLAASVMGISFLGFLAGAWMLKWKYRSRIEMEFTLRTIEEELRRRAALRGRSAQL